MAPGPKKLVFFVAWLRNQKRALATFFLTVGTATAALSATGLSASPTALNFGTVLAGDTKSSVTWVTNNSSNTISDLKIKLTQSGTGFSVANPSGDTRACTANLPALSNCRITVAFESGSLGTQTGTLTVSSAANSYSLPIGVSATAVNTALSATSSTLSFGTLASGNSKTLVDWISNNTNSAVSALSVGLVQSNAGFSIASTAKDPLACGASLPAFGDCRLTVTFSATTAESESGTITVSAGSNKVSVGLTGATVSSAISDGAPSVNFGTVESGYTKSLSDWVFNDTSQAITNLSIGLTQSNSGFAVIGAPMDPRGCTANLPSLGNCRITVNFTASKAENETGTITVAAGATKLKIELQASAVTSVLSVSAASESFGSVVSGSTKTLAAWVTNNTPTKITNLSVGLTQSNSGYAVLGPASDTRACTASLPAFSSCRLSIVFTASDPRTETGKVTASSGSNTVQVTLSAVSIPMSTDVLVYAATPGGIAAAIEAAHLGKEVVLIEPSKHVGGMMTSGLGTSDVYGTNVIGGIAKTFFQTIQGIYGSSYNTVDFNGTRFEPHIAEQAFTQLIGAQSKISVVFGTYMVGTTKSGATVATFKGSNNITYAAKEYVDASYEGDLMAAAKVSYTVGREPSSKYGESFAGVRPTTLFNGLSIDPYVTAGNPASGLLPHVESLTLGALGSGDGDVMAYTYRLCFSADTSNQIPFSPPANYDPSEFELLGRFSVAQVASGKSTPITLYLGPGSIPNNKYDVNNGSPFSTDDIGANSAYPEANRATRAQIAAEHLRYIQALLYFIATDPRIPSNIQTRLNQWGLCKDEFTDNGGWPRQLYVREARRMIGKYIMKQADVQATTTISDSIGLGGWPIDSHDVHRVALSGAAQNEGDMVSQPVASVTPFRISYSALVPQQTQAVNLIVPVDMSASHVGYSAIRLEPTYMIMGQAAGAAASLAIDEKVPVQQVNYSALSSTLVNDGAVLTNP